MYRLHIHTFRIHARRLGAPGLTLLSTGLSILLSVAITVVAMKLWRPGISLALPVGIAIFAPLLIAPSITYFVVQFLLRIDQLEREKGQAVEALKQAMAEVKHLSGMLPICASCKKIRDDQGYWHQVEVYITEHSEADFSHGICPECCTKMYSEYFPQGRSRPSTPET